MIRTEQSQIVLDFVLLLYKMRSKHSPHNEKITPYSENITKYLEKKS